MNENKIMVERETYVKNDKTYFTYFVKGNVRGVDVKVSVIPPDIGGYTVLDIVFNGNLQANLIVEPFEFKDDSGKVFAGTNYLVRSVDEDGTIYECKIKPAKASDKTLLQMLVR